MNKYLLSEGLSIKMNKYLLSQGLSIKMNKYLLFAGLFILLQFLSHIVTICSTKISFMMAFPPYIALCMLIVIYNVDEYEYRYELSACILFYMIAQLYRGIKLKKANNDKTRGIALYYIISSTFIIVEIIITSLFI